MLQGYPQAAQQLVVEEEEEDKHSSNSIDKEDADNDLYPGGAAAELADLVYHIQRQEEGNGEEDEEDL